MWIISMAMRGWRILPRLILFDTNVENLLVKNSVQRWRVYITLLGKLTEIKRWQLCSTYRYYLFNFCCIYLLVVRCTHTTLTLCVALLKSNLLRCLLIVINKHLKRICFYSFAFWVLCCKTNNRCRSRLLCVVIDRADDWCLDYLEATVMLGWSFILRLIRLTVSLKSLKHVICKECAEYFIT